MNPPVVPPQFAATSRSAAFCEYGIGYCRSDTPLPDNGGVSGDAYWAEAAVRAATRGAIHHPLRYRLAPTADSLYRARVATRSVLRRSGYSIADHSSTRRGPRQDVNAALVAPYMGGDPGVGVRMLRGVGGLRAWGLRQAGGLKSRLKVLRTAKATFVDWASAR